jgi:hypothetical protein
MVYESFKKRAGMSADNLVQMMREEGTSINAVKRYQKRIREHFGKSGIESHAQRAVTDATHQLDDFYELVDLLFWTKEGCQETRDIAFLLIFVKHFSSEKN